MTSELPRRARMMIMIRTKVETNFTAKLNDLSSVVGDVVVFRILVDVELAILCKRLNKSSSNSCQPLNKYNQNLELLD